MGVRLARLGVVVGAARGVFVVIGAGRFGKEGLEAVVAEVADWKSSKSSSTAVVDWRELTPLSRAVFLLFDKNSFGGVSGGTSSSKPRMSISGSFGLGGSAFLASRRAEFVENVSDFRRAGVDAAPSSASSYSSKRSRLLLESWKPDWAPPNPPPSP